MSKKEETENNLLIDALVRIKTLENILIEKGVFTAQEYVAAVKHTTAQIAKIFLEKAKVPGDLDKIVKDLQEKIQNN